MEVLSRIIDIWIKLRCEHFVLLFDSFSEIVSFEIAINEKNYLSFSQNDNLINRLQAVKRSRVKSKQRAEETKFRVDNLKSQNTRMEERITEKEKNLKSLKELFLDAAKVKTETNKNVDLKKLLADDDDDDDILGGTSSSNK